MIRHRDSNPDTPHGPGIASTMCGSLVCHEVIVYQRTNHLQGVISPLESGRNGGGVISRLRLTMKRLFCGFGRTGGWCGSG